MATTLDMLRTALRNGASVRDAVTVADYGVPGMRRGQHKVEQAQTPHPTMRGKMAQKFKSYMSEAKEVEDPDTYRKTSPLQRLRDFHLYRRESK